MSISAWQKRWPSVKVKHLGCRKATNMRASNSHKDLIFSENSNSSGFSGPWWDIVTAPSYGGLVEKKTTTTQQLALRHQQSLYIPTTVDIESVAIQALIDVTCGLSNARVAGAPPSRMANSHPRAVPWDERWEGRKRCGEMVVGCRIGG